MEIDVKPSTNSQIQFSSGFRAKLSLTSSKIWVDTAIPVSIWFCGERGSSFFCVIHQNRRKMLKRIRVSGFGQLHLLFTLHATNV